MAEELALPFRVLSALGLPTIADYGLLHEGAGPGGATIPVPAELLVRPDGSIAWKHVARRIQDRAAPERVLEELERLR